MASGRVVKWLVYLHRICNLGRSPGSCRSPRWFLELDINRRSSLLLMVWDSVHYCCTTGLYMCHGHYSNIYFLDSAYSVWMHSMCIIHIPRRDKLLVRTYPPSQGTLFAQHHGSWLSTDLYYVSHIPFSRATCSELTLTYRMTVTYLVCLITFVERAVGFTSLFRYCNGEYGVCHHRSLTCKCSQPSPLGPQVYSVVG